MADIDSARDKISTYGNVMKTNCWLLVGLLLAGNLFAQQLSNVPPAGPVSAPPALPAAPATTNAAPALSTAKTDAPAKPAASKKKKRSKKPASAVPAPKAKAPAKTSHAVTRSEPLTMGPATVIASNVNVRGQAKLNSEVLTRLTKGESVTVLEEIILTNSGPDEPSAWAKIQLPSERPVWISALFVDTNKNTTSTRINMRGGPGENYSILGRLEKGTDFKPIDTKGEWIKIETPTNAYAFVAAQYLKTEAAPVAPEIADSGKKAEPAPAPAEPAPVTEAPTMADAPADKPAVPAPEPVAPAAETPSIQPAAPEATDAPVAEEPPPRRIVQREGLVRGTVSIQAPSYFSLVSPETKQLINYLISPSPELDLRRFKGMHVIVTGEEGLEERWGNTPVLTIDKIEVVE
jgi:hypothetical protein